MPEFHHPLPESHSVWGISISAGESDIDISVSNRAWGILKLGSRFFGILFVITMCLSVFLCFFSDNPNHCSGVLHASQWVDLRLPDSSEPGALQIEEVLVAEGSVVASGQALIRYASETGPSSSLIAPRAGIVEMLSLRPFQQVPSKSPACRLAGLQTLTFHGKVPESSLEKISPGKSCRLNLNAFPDRSFSGIIEEIGGKGEFDPTHGYSFFPIRIRVANPDQCLRIGMSGNALVP